MDRPIDKPIPMPLALVVKNVLKIRSKSSGEMPVPESSIATRDLGL
jgi:hypothetical protein